MYHVWIPVYNRKWSDKQKQELVTLLQTAKTDLVLLTAGRILCDEQMRKQECDMFRENMDFLQANGFSVGA